MKIRGSSSLLSCTISKMIYGVFYMKDSDDKKWLIYKLHGYILIISISDSGNLLTLLNDYYMIILPLVNQARNKSKIFNNSKTNDIQ